MSNLPAHILNIGGLGRRSAPGDGAAVRPRRSTLRRLLESIQQTADEDRAARRIRGDAVIFESERELADLRDKRRREGLFAALQRRGLDHATLDLSRIRRANTSIVATIVLAQRAAVRRGVALDVRCSPEIRRWIDICRVDAIAHPDERRGAS